MESLHWEFSVPEERTIGMLASYSMPHFLRRPLFGWPTEIILSRRCPEFWNIQVMVISDCLTETVCWFGQRASRALITDSGNFIVLGDAHNESAIVWESFAHPTDTYLPGMKLWKGTALTSWMSSSDPATGLFSCRLDTAPGKSQLLLLFNNTVPYESSGECIRQNYFTKLPYLEGEKKMHVSCVRLSPSRIYISYVINLMDHMVTGRFVLNKNGELQIYFWMDDNSWSLRWSTYRGQCSDYEICGGRHTRVNAVTMKSAGCMDSVMRTMCAVVSRASRPRTALKVGGQTGVLGEHPCIALLQRARLTVSLKPRTSTCPKKKLSYARTSRHSKAAGLLVSAIALAQPFLLVFLIHLSVVCGLVIYWE